MRINCLNAQEGLFETRLLRRVIEPVFVEPENILPKVDGPLLLYGQWYPTSFLDGLRWLSTFVFHLLHPCILLPPFESGLLSDSLGLTTQLNVLSVNSNRLSIPPNSELSKVMSNQVLKIQTDFAFKGPTGKPWLFVSEQPLAGLMQIQPKNTSTPLLLCGLRLLSASGLSLDEDRVTLLEHIVNWAWGWKQISDPDDTKATVPVRLNESTWQVVCIVLTASRLTVLKEVAAMSESLFNIQISQADLEIAQQRLVDYGLANKKGENLELKLDALESYTQQNGLWAYVRTLRKDFERTQP